jgi:hypothetical protein
MTTDTVNEGPLSRTEIDAMVSPGNYDISGEVRFGLDELIDMDFEGILDTMSERLTGSILGQDIRFEATRIDARDVIIKVTLDVSGIMDDW